jgi:acyl-ACP thioesterase
VRSIRIDVLAPPAEDDLAELTTWSSGRASIAAARRMSLAGDRGGRVELDSVWVHLARDARPARIEDFGPYAESAGNRLVSTRLELQAPGDGAARGAWPLRTTDLDVLGHVNNAAYWHAVEQRLPEAGIDARRPFRARLDYRHPLDLGDPVDLLEATGNGTLALAFTVDGQERAVAVVEQLEVGTSAATS